MTDRELLELAAKAAGIDAEWHSDDDADFYAEHEGMFLKGARSLDNNKYWNPLTDDGDALRLAVKADIDVVQMGDATRADYMIGIGFCTVEVPHGNDPYAATRRAIVRAAAEIGRSKT
jgi:hypothetical protein